jgi:hypothetical protein
MEENTMPREYGREYRFDYGSGNIFGHASEDFDGQDDAKRWSVLANVQFLGAFDVCLADQEKITTCSDSLGTAEDSKWTGYRL